MKILTLLAMLILVCCSVGCGPSSDVTFTFEGSEEHFVMATEAAEEWNGVCGTHFVITREGGHVPMYGTTDMKTSVPRAAITAWGDFRQLEEVRYVPDLAYRVVFAHELGHVAGVEHKDVGVMLAVANIRAHVTPSDCP